MIHFIKNRQIKTAIVSILTLLSISAKSETELDRPNPGIYFNKVLTIVLENTDFDDAMKDPYLNELSKRGALLTNFDALTHPSYSNYLAMVAGSTFFTLFDIQVNFNKSTIADLLEAKSLTWKNYAEGLPSPCYLRSKKGNYVRKHVPFLSFKPIQKDPARCANIVDESAFYKDANTGNLPNFSIYSPNLDNDGHDTDVTYASTWLKTKMGPLFDKPAFMANTMVEITFDESATRKGNHIYTLLFGPMVKEGLQVDTHLDHYNVLRTIENNFAIGTLGRHDEKATPIDGIWK